MISKAGNCLNALSAARAGNFGARSYHSNVRPVNAGTTPQAGACLRSFSPNIT